MPIDLLKIKRRLISEYDLDPNLAEGVIHAIAIAIDPSEQRSIAEDVTKEEITEGVETRPAAPRSESLVTTDILEARLEALRSDFSATLWQSNAVTVALVAALLIIFQIFGGT